MEIAHLVVGVDIDGEEHAWYPCASREEAEARKVVAEEEFFRVQDAYKEVMRADDEQRILTDSPDFWKMQGMKVQEFVIKEI